MSRSWAGGSTRQWRRLRELVLERDGRRCQVPRTDGRPCGAHATHVDHIVPLADGGPKWDPTNLRAACAPCNLSRGTSTTRSGPTARVHVLIGPPAGGKTTMARELATNGDIVVDLDALASVLGAEVDLTHDYPKHVRHVAIGARAAAIRRAVALAADVCEVWIIHAVPSVEQVAQYVADGWDVVVVDPGPDVVTERITHSTRGHRHIDAANTWYHRREQLLAAIEPPEDWTL